MLSSVVALARAESRASAAATLGALLGGERVLVFLRDREVGALLPPPGFPQTLPDARAWRRFVEECAERGERVGRVASPEGGARVPAYGFSCGRDIVVVVLGTDRRADEVDEVRALLPLLAAVFDGERSAALAQTQARMARNAAAHAEALARALDSVRGQLQQALAEAERARRELELANEQLSDQAMELEAQTIELEMQAEELIRTNDALEAARRTAEAASRAKSEFLATMSHELRTPLNAISGHAELLALGIYGPVTETQRDALDRIDRSQRHLLGLINDILNLARIESGRIDYEIEELPVAEVLADLAPMIEPQISAKRLHYETHLADPRLAVRADREKLQQVLLNLLSNAVKFTAPGGSIIVEGASPAEGEAGVVFLRVADTGCGIPSDKLDAIFEPFTQVDASHSRTGQGTGLGLAISRDLARGMGGDLRVRSAVGMGSAFTLSLPAAAT